MSIGPHAKLRRAARLAAVQALYQLDMGDDLLSGTVVNEFMEHRFIKNGDGDVSSVDEEFFKDIVEGVVKFQSDIDAGIASNLSESQRCTQSGIWFSRTWMSLISSNY